jgi:hypothetical protein
MSAATLIALNQPARLNALMPVACEPRGAMRQAVAEHAVRAIARPGVGRKTCTGERQVFKAGV